MKKKIKVEFYRHNQVSLENVKIDGIPSIINNMVLEVNDTDRILYVIRPVFTGETAMVKFEKEGTIILKISEITGAEHEKILMRIICTNSKDSKLSFNHVSKDHVKEIITLYPYNFMGPLGYTGLRRTIPVNLLIDDKFPIVLPTLEGHIVHSEVMQSYMMLPMTHPSVDESIRHFINTSIDPIVYQRIGIKKFSIQTAFLEEPELKYDIDLENGINVEVTEPVEIKYNAPVLYVGESSLYANTFCSHCLEKAKESIYDKVCMIDLRDMKGNIVKVGDDMMYISDKTAQDPDILLPVSYNTRELAKNITKFIFNILSKDFSYDEITTAIPAELINANVVLKGSDYTIINEYVSEHNTTMSISRDRRTILGCITRLYMDTRKYSPDEIDVKVGNIMMKIYLMIQYSGLNS